MSDDLFSFDPEDMMVEYHLLKQELDRYNDLYDKVEEEINSSKSKTRIPYVYLSSQYGTLSTILNHRQSVIAKLFDMKKTVEDFKLKYRKVEESEHGEENDNRAIIRDLIKMLNDKTIPYNDIDQISISDQDHPDMDEIGDHLDNMFHEDEEGVLRTTETEVIEETVDDVIQDINTEMQRLDIKVTVNEEDKIIIIKEIAYGDSIVRTPYDVTQLKEKNPTLFKFLTDADNFSVDEDNDLLVPEDFTEYVFS